MILLAVLSVTLVLHRILPAKTVQGGPRGGPPGTIRCLRVTDPRLYPRTAREPTPTYALSAVAKLASAKSSVLRDVAMFIRRWLKPAMPQSDPAFI